MQNSKTATQSMQERRKNPMKNRIVKAFKRTGNVLTGKSGDQMTGWLIVVLVVVVVGAVFLTLYQGSITDIWNNIVTKITSLLS